MKQCGDFPFVRVVLSLFNFVDNRSKGIVVGKFKFVQFVEGEFSFLTQYVSVVGVVKIFNHSATVVPIQEDTFYDLPVCIVAFLWKWHRSGVGGEYKRLVHGVHSCQGIAANRKFSHCLGALRRVLQVKH